MKRLCTTFATLVLGLTVFGQTPGKAYDFLDGNQVRARISNSSDHFWDLTSSPQYEVPKGTGKHLNFAGALWIGGMDNMTNLRVSGQTYRQRGEDYYSGPYRSTHNYDVGVGFQVPRKAEMDGVIAIGGGLHMVIYDYGFTVYDPLTNTIAQHNIGQTRTRLKGVYLQNGKTLIFGDNTYPTVSDAYLVDANNGYVPTTALQLNYYHRHSASVMLQNGKVLIAGIAGTELYDPQTNTSSPTQPMAVPVMATGAVLLQDGRVFIAGGNQTFSSYNSPVFFTQLFDPNTNSWAQGPNLPAGLTAPLTLLQSNGKVLLIGGSTNSVNIFEYDPVSNGVATVGQLPFEMQHVKGGLLPNGEVLFMGSTGISGGNSSLIKFNPATSQIRQINLTLLGQQAWIGSNGKAVIEFSPLEFKQFDFNTEQVVDMPYQKIWKLSAAEIQQFRQDFQNNSVNFANYPDIQTWPGNGITSLGEDQSLAPFVDVNNDGLYRPLLHGDYPCILGDQALWWVYNDDGPHTETGGLPVGVQVECMAYVFDCFSSPCPDTNIAYTTFYHFEITTKGASPISNTYIGLWNDTDLGNWADDYIGCDTARQLGYVYNGDALDETNLGYGIFPPAFGVTLLGGTSMDKFITYDNDFSGTGNPELPEHFYNYLQGKWRDSSQLINNGASGHYLTGQGTPSNYIFPGDPGACTMVPTGWSEFSANNMPFDRRMIQSTGPLTLQPNTSVSFDAAYIYARGFYNDNLGSVCELFNSTDNIRQWWDGLDKSCFNIVLNQEKPHENGSLSIFPNPASSEVTISLPDASKATTVQIIDMAGRIVQVNEIRAGQGSVEIPVSELAEGMYLVKLTSNSTQYTAKLTVQH